MREPDLTLPLHVRVQRLFYIISPNESSFKTIEDVPDYVAEVSFYKRINLTLDNLIFSFTEMLS